MARLLLSQRSISTLGDAVVPPPIELAIRNNHWNIVYLFYEQLENDPIITNVQHNTTARTVSHAPRSLKRTFSTIDISNHKKNSDESVDEGKKQLAKKQRWDKYRYIAKKE